MKQSQAFIPTIREIPTHVEARSHELLLRAGFIRQHSSGIYAYLPFGLRVLRKIESIVREEMEQIKAVEILTPTLQKADLYQNTNRDCAELFNLHDRNNRQYILGSLQAEVTATLVRDEVKSYKQLPLMIYQIITKFKDENRPRLGLIQNREFIVKDAYSFHSSSENFQEKYERIRQVYSAVFSKLNLEVYEISDSSDELSAHKFIVHSEEGEQTIAYSTTGTFSSSIEEATVTNHYEPSSELPKEIEKVETPNIRTVKEIASFLDIPMEKIIKTLVYKVEGEFVVVLVRGDHEINEYKLQKVFKTHSIQLAQSDEIMELLSCEIGSIGPVKLPVGIKIIADNAVKAVVNGVVGANEDNYHLVNVNPEQDFAVNEYADLRYVNEGDTAPDGIGTIQFTSGFEVGRLISLATSFSEQMDAIYVDEQGDHKPYIIGHYEMNLSRIMAAVAEQYNDEQGLKWPKNLAPYDIHLVPINLKDERQKELADNLYKLLQSYRFGVLYDDRPESPGVKFTDADLIGLPIRITIGKKANEGILEVKFRETGETTEWQVEEVTEKLQAYFTLH